MDKQAKQSTQNDSDLDDELAAMLDEMEMGSDDDDFMGSENPETTLPSSNNFVQVGSSMAAEVVAETHRVAAVVDECGSAVARPSGSTVHGSRSRGVVENAVAGPSNQHLLDVISEGAVEGQDEAVVGVSTRRETRNAASKTAEAKRQGKKVVG